MDSATSGADGARAEFENQAKMLSETDASLSAVRSQRDQYQQRLTEGKADIYGDDLRDEAQKDPVVQGYEQKLAGLRDSLGALRKQGFGEKHPDLQTLNAQIAEAETQRLQKIDEVLQRLCRGRSRRSRARSNPLTLSASPSRRSWRPSPSAAKWWPRPRSAWRPSTTRSTPRPKGLSKTRAALSDVEALGSRPNENSEAIGDRVRVISRGVIPKGVSFPKIELIVPRHRRPLHRARRRVPLPA